MINWILKNKKFSKLIFLLVLFLIALFIVSYFQNRNNEPKVCFGNQKIDADAQFLDDRSSDLERNYRHNCFYVEIVDEENERTQGLMFRESMDENKGMLFVFDSEGVYPFWMKNTILPLDIIWINSEKEIVFIKKNAEPHNTIPINPESSALYVLELNAGISEKIGLNISSKASFIGVQVG